METFEIYFRFRVDLLMGLCREWERGLRILFKIFCLHTWIAFPETRSRGIEGLFCLFGCLY